MAEERVQRRLAAILAADVAGYSRLMGADEEGTLKTLTLYRGVITQLVEEHQGRVVDAVGDSVLAEFGSAVQAVRSAVAIQRALDRRNADLEEARRMHFRIGINVGDVMVQGTDLLGDGVNIAARLEQLAKPGSIFVSGTVWEQIEGKLSFPCAYVGEQTMKNIARPVRTYRVAWGQPENVTSPLSAPQVAPPLPEKPSIAVLPFANMSSDPDQEYFAEGLAEDLITDLSKVPGFFVIARNSSFSYKGRSIDIRTIASDLGARYVVEGSVRRVATRVRINAQLVEAVTGRHVWADRFDRDLNDIFLMQDEVVGKIVTALAGVLPPAGSLPNRRPANLESYELFIRGRSLVSLSLEDTRGARPLLERAVELDPTFAAAYAWLAMSHINGWAYCGEGEEHRKLALSAAQQSISLDPENADAHIVLGYLRALEGALSEGVAEIERGLRINPNHADGWTFLADLRVLESRALEAIECARNAFRLNPHPPGNYYWPLGFAQYGAGRYQDAVETLRHKSARGMGVRRILAAALAQLDRISEAREEARKFLLEFPQFSARQWGRTQPFQNDADRQHFIDGYVKAGLPE